MEESLYGKHRVWLRRYSKRTVNTLLGEMSVREDVGGPLYMAELYALEGEGIISCTRCYTPEHRKSTPSKKCINDDE